MTFKEYFDKKFADDFGFLPRLIGLAPREDEDGVWYEVDVEDPYETSDTRACVLLDCLYCEPQDREEGEYRLIKPHSNYSFEDRYKFMVHQLKYMVVDHWLRGGFEKPDKCQNDILFYPGQLDSKVFAGIDKQTNRAFRVYSGNVRAAFPFLPMETHIEDNCMGMQSSHGVVALPVGSLPGILVHTDTEYGLESISIKIVKLYSSDGELKRHGESVVMDNRFKNIQYNLSDANKTPWDELIHTHYDLHRNPNNKEFWHLLAEPTYQYDGQSIFVNKDESMELVYAKVEDEWVPVDKEWLTKSPTKVFKHAADELRLISNIESLAGSTSLQ